MDMVGSKTTGSTTTRKVVVAALAASSQPPIPPQQNTADSRALVPSHPDQVRVSHVAKSALINMLETLIPVSTL